MTSVDLTLGGVSSTGGSSSTVPGLGGGGTAADFYKIGGGSSGSSPWGWNPITDLGNAAHAAYDYLNPVGAVKSFVTGIGSSLGEPIVNVGRAVGDIATGNTDAAGRAAIDAVRGVGDIGGQTITGLQNLGADAFHAVGTVPGLEQVSNQYDQFMQRENLLMSHFVGFSDAERQQLAGVPDANGYVRGAAPSDVIQQAEHGGLASAVIGHLGTLAMVAGPVASMTGAAAETTTGAAASALEAGDTALSHPLINSIAEGAAHPYRFISEQTAGFLKANQLEAAGQALQGVTDAVSGIRTPTPVTAPTHMTPEDHAAVTASMDPQVAGAEAMTASHTVMTAPADSGSLFAEAGLGVPPGTTRFSRVGAPGSEYVEGLPNPSRASGTSAADMGRVHTVDVPSDVAATLPRGPNGEVTIPDEYIKSNGQERASTPNPTKIKVPNRMNPDGTMRTKSQMADDAAQLHDEERQAAESAPTLVAEDRAGQRIAMPPPAWAQRVAQALPDSMNRVLAKVANGTVDKVAFKELQRNVQQFAERAQQHGRSSAFMHAGQAAADIIWSANRSLDPEKVSQALGQEIIKRVNGDMLTQNFVNRELSPGDPLPEPILKALLEKAGANYPGVTSDMTAGLSDAQKTQLEATIQAGVEQYKADTLQTMQTLLSTRYGARGLESQLLDPNEVVMSAKDVALYRKAMGDLRREQVWRGKLPDLIQRNQQQAIQSAWHGNRIADSLVRLQDRIGINHQTIEDLHQGVAPGLKDDASIAASAHALLDDAARTEAAGGRWGATLDAGTGEAIHPTLGHTVATAHQATIDAATFEADPVGAIQNAILHPHNTDGSTNYDPNSLWGGTDAHLTVSKSPDGTSYNIDITQHTLNGVPMNVMQASTLGEAFEQPSIHINASGEDLPLSEHPLDQAIAAHYLDQIMDPSSPVNTMWNTAQATAQEVGIPQHQLLREFNNRMLMDYAFAQRSSLHEIGDLFNAKYEVAEGMPRNAALFGTTVDMTTAAGVEAALKTYQGKQLTKILGWYKESHDYIEQNYRGKVLPGTTRDAADVFYDLLAVTSVMASPLQNLGRALMGFSNLDELYRQRAGSALVTQEIMDKAMSLPPGSSYVKDIGKPTERLVGPGEGTKVSDRFLNTPEFRKLTHQTSMTTSPKYNVIDILTGRLDLGNATADTIDRMPEFWTGERRGLSNENLRPNDVAGWIDRLGIKTKGAQAAVDAGAQLDALQNHPSTPITESDMANQSGRGRTVTPVESRALAEEGKVEVDRRLANSSAPTGLDNLDVHRLYQETRPEVNDGWGGDTIDAHTGASVVKATDGTDQMSLTVRLPGMKEITVDPNADEATFARGIEQAKQEYATILASEGAHLGIFRNDTTGRIEIDPTYVVGDSHQVETIGSYTHANGGAYHYQTGNGVWVPNITDASADVGAARRNFLKLAQSKSVRPAYEQAMLEHTGSAGLAKLRSFRANLSDPDHSLNVTLDSVMAKLWGMDKTDWGKGTNYADKAQEIRDQATQLSARLGRTVMPHEVQALLWVFTKEYVGTQDWSRLLAHHDVAMSELNTIGDTLAAGGKVDPRTLKFLDDWKEEELGYSRSALAVRGERKALSAKATAGTLTPEERTTLDQLQQFPDRHAQPVRIDVNANSRGKDISDTSGANYQEVQRNESPYDAKVLASKEAQFVKYDKVKAEVQALIAKGTPDAISEAKAKLSSYVAKRERSIKGDAEGGNFRDVGDKAIKQSKSVQRTAADRLAQPGGYVPSPGASMGSTDALRETFNGQVRGVTMLDAGRTGRMVARLFQGADIATLVHEDMHLLRLMAPADEVAQMEAHYPHINDPLVNGTLTAARRADEEKFVEDFMGYMAQKAHNGDMPWTRSPSAAFRSAAQTMDDIYASHLSTAAGQTTPLDVRNYWDGLLNPEIVKPSVYTDPLSSQYVKPVGGVQTVQRRFESDAQYAQRVRQFGEARQRSATLQVQKQALLQQQAKVDRATSKMMGLWNEGGEAGVQVARMADQAHRLAERSLGKIDERLGNPSLANVPRAWQPMVQSFQEMAALIREDPNAGEMATVLSEIPDTFQAVMQYAAAHGFEPTYVPEMTEEAAAKLMYRHMNLSADPEMARMRKANLGVLRGKDIAARNLEVLSSAQVAATKEMLQSKVIDFVEKYWAKPLVDGTTVPPGYEAWDAARQGIITGKEQTGLGRRIAATAGDTSYIIPKHVGDALRKMQEPYSRWGGDTGVPRFILKGGPTALWKNIMLTYSPTWYMKHFLGAVSNAVLAGAHWTDFRTAVRQAWTKDEFGIRGADLPDAVRGRSIWGMTDEEGSATPGSFLQRGLRTTAASEGTRGVLHDLNARMRNIVKVTDGLGRAAVYASKMREGLGPEVAAEAAFTSLGDFGNLSAIERGLVATILPFYPFQKAMFKIMMRLPADHPYASSIFMNVGQMHQQMLEQELNGSIPDNLIGSDMIGGHLISYAKINPLIDTYKLVTPQGILSSVHPFIQLFLQDGLHAPTFSGKAGMGEYGQLVSKPAVGQQLQDVFGSAPTIGAGADIFGSSNAVAGAVVPVKTYTDAQWQALLKRISKTAASIATADKTGGYLALDAVAPTGGSGSGGYGSGTY